MELVITDVTMPQMGGLVLVERLVLIRPDVKVIYMSGYVEDVPSLLSNGHLFIEKPFPPGALLEKVNEILSS